MLDVYFAVASTALIVGAGLGALAVFAVLDRKVQYLRRLHRTTTVRLLFTERENRDLRQVVEARGRANVVTHLGERRKS